MAVWQVEKAPTESYADVGGLETQIQEIKEAVELPLTHPELYEDIGIKPPKVTPPPPHRLRPHARAHTHTHILTHTLPCLQCEPSSSLQLHITRFLKNSRPAAMCANADSRVLVKHLHWS